MAALKIDAVRGPVSFDDMRNPVQNIYIKKVEKTKMFGYDKDELWNMVIKTYPAVSQFWTYGKDEFLASSRSIAATFRPARIVNRAPSSPGLAQQSRRVSAMRVCA